MLYHKVLIEALPEPNRKLLFRLLPYLARVIEHEAVNKMAIHNVATGTLSQLHHLSVQHLTSS